MSGTKTNSGERLAIANLYRTVRGIFRRRSIKGVKVRFLMNRGALTMRLFGLPDDMALAKFELDAAFKPTR